MPRISLLLLSIAGLAVAGRTVRGPDDPRLGKIDGVLLSHVHLDHLGDMHSSAANAGECAQPEFDVKDAPSSNTEKIVVAKKAKFFVGGEMNSWFGVRIPAAGGDKSQVITLALEPWTSSAGFPSGACRPRTATVSVRCSSPAISPRRWRRTA